MVDVGWCLVTVIIKTRNKHHVIVSLPENALI